MRLIVTDIRLTRRTDFFSQVALRFAPPFAPMMTATSAEATAAREVPDEAENEENAHPEEHVAFRAKWNEGKSRSLACRCSYVCLTSTHNISRALLCAVAKAAVYQSKGKIFGDPKAAIEPLSADLLAKLEGGKGAGERRQVLSDLQRDIQEWKTSKKTAFASLGETFGGAKASDDAAEVLEKTISRGDGWSVADRERVSRELLLRYDRNCLAHCEEAFETPEELLRHKTRCAFRPTQCPNDECVEVFCANVAGVHDQTCPFKLLPCPQKCGSDVQRRAMRAHLADECDRRPATCPFAALGCGARCDAGTLDAHVRDAAPAHVALLARRVEALRESAERADGKTAALAVAVADVAGRVTSAARDVSGLERAAQAAETSAANAHAAAKKTKKEHDALLAGVAKAIAALESESKKQRKEIAAVVQAMDKLAKEVREK